MPARLVAIRLPVQRRCVCETLERENLLQNVQSRGEQLRAGLIAITAKYPDQVTEVRGWGLINGMVLKQ